MMVRVKRVATITIAVILLTLPVAIQRQGFMAEVHASNAGLSLYASVPGWNSSKPSGSNPTLIVRQGDSVALSLISGDASTHLFVLDVDKNGPQIDCPGSDKCSGAIGSGQTVPFYFAVDFAPGSYKYYCFYHPTTMVGTFNVQAVPDFTVGFNPSSLTLAPASHGSFTITITSQAGLGGTMTLLATPPNGLAASMNPTSVNLAANGTAMSTLNVTAASSTSTGTYNITVSGTLGSTSHSAIVQVFVTSPSDGIGILFYELVFAVVAAAVIIATTLYFIRKNRTKRST